jgi:hypothetical protein
MVVMVQGGGGEVPHREMKYDVLIAPSQEISG